MSTAAQQKASRQNGFLSSGPVTAEGKSRSAQNAIRHGLTGGPLVLPDESQQEYDAFLQSCIKTWRPKTLLELELVDQMVAAKWRLRRIARMEAAIINQAFEREMDAMGDQANQAVAMQRAYAEVTENSKGWKSLSRHQRALQRAYGETFQTYLQVSEQYDANLREDSRTTVGAKQQPQTSAVQNEPESDYSSLRSLYAEQGAKPDFMAKMLACLHKTNNATAMQNTKGA